MKTIIGIYPFIDEHEKSVTAQTRYIEALEEENADVIILPLAKDEETIRRQVDLCDGVLFSGGVDVDPAEYGETQSINCGTIQKRRDYAELTALKYLYEQNKPFLGICRGIQVIAVAFGGKLIQDIPTETESNVDHYQSEPYDVPKHKVNVIKDSLLYETVGKTVLDVNSMHHQSVKSVSDKIKVTAMSEDSLIEAIEIEGICFGMGVQWHPECMRMRDADSKLIFKKFVSAVEKRKKEQK